MLIKTVEQYDMRLHQKLSNIRGGNYQKPDFIIADAKDGDMAFGCATAGANEAGVSLPLAKYRYVLINIDW
jgi:hypothetical protein